MPDAALIVIDVQNEYFAGGQWALPDGDQALERILLLIQKARAASQPVVYVQHILGPEAPLFAQGTPGAELKAELPVNEGDIRIEKQHPSAFQETGLAAALEAAGIKRLDICGFMTQMCCDTTTREAYGRGYQVRLFSDATAAKDLEMEGQTIPHRMVHLASLSTLSRFAQVLKAEAF